MPQCSQAPTIHPGPLHVGPAIPWALRAGDSPAKPDTGTKPKRRKKWNERHQITWANDAQAPNTRCYFGRHVDREDVPVVPRRRLRPTWVLDVPEVESSTQAYRIFDPLTASWKEQPQWTMPDMNQNMLMKVKHAEQKKATTSKSGSLQPRTPEKEDLDLEEPPNILLSAVDAAKKLASQPPKIRTPRKPADLLHQREREKTWDRKHAVVFSKDNAHMQVNVRSYFDRWKDFEGGHHERAPSWRLAIEKKPLISKCASEPYIPRFAAQGGRYGAWHPVF